MALTFYYGAGSPYAWRVWLALEHKAIPYDRKVISFEGGDLRTPEFRALNPRAKVPVVVDDGFALFESAAILEYLDDAYPDSGARLFPGAVRERAQVRRMVCEADHYLGPVLNRLFFFVFLTKPEEWNAARIAATRDEVAAEIARWEGEIRGEFLAARLSAADFTLYPMLALALRCETPRPDLALRERLPARIAQWMRVIEALPFFPPTWPAHWK